MSAFYELLDQLANPKADPSVNTGPLAQRILAGGRGGPYISPDLSTQGPASIAPGQPGDWKSPAGIVPLMPVDQAAAIDQRNLRRKSIAESLNPDQRKAFITADRQFQYLSPLFGKNAQAQEDIAGSVLNSLGIKTERDKIIQAARDAQTAKTKTPIDPDLMKSLGTTDFDIKLADGVATGKITDPNQQLALERLHNAKLKQTMVSDQDRRGLTNVKGTVELLTNIENAFKETPAYKSGRVGAALKTALALTQKGASAIELAGIMERLTPEERRYVSLFKSSRLSLRRVSEDSRFSNFDAEQLIDALGNPIVGPKLYLDLLRASKEELIRRHDNALSDMKTQGRRTEGFGTIGQSKGPKAGDVLRGYKFKGGDPSKKENWEKQ